MDKLKLLSKVPAFSRLTEEQLALLASSVGSQSFERGEMIFHQGSIGSALYIIVGGQVRIYTISAAGQELTLAIFRAGDFFGELALLSGQPRNASVVASRPLETYVLGEQDFHNAINASESFRDQLRRVYFLRH